MKKVIMMVVVVVLLVCTFSITVIAADWTEFGAGNDNNSVTDAQTPTSEEQAVLKFKATVKDAASWDANSNVLIVGDYIYVGYGTEIMKLNKEGVEVDAVTLTGSMSSYAPYIAYGNGMIFAYVNDFTNGYIEAVDAATMQRVWVSEGIAGMNGFSPITISGESLYVAVSGYDWGNYVTTPGFVIGMTIADDNTGSQDEVKTNTFTYDGGLSYYWNGIAVEGNVAIVGSVEGVLQTINITTGALIEGYDAGAKIATSITYAGGKAYFGTSANFGADGSLISVDVAVDGNIAEGTALVCALGSQVTTTPVVSGGRVYVGTGDFSGGAGFFVVDAAAMTSVYSAEIPGIDSWSGADIAIAGVQSTPVLTTAYSDTYVYFSINAKPGGITMLKDSAGQVTADVTTIFTPEAADQNATLAEFVAGEDGTIYYTNDSGYLFAVGKSNEVINPQTGDNSNTAVYLILGIAILAALAIALRKLLVKA